MSEVKFCPMSALFNNADNNGTFCIKDQCAWWDEHHKCCCLMSISGELSVMNGKNPAIDDDLPY